MKPEKISDIGWSVVCDGWEVEEDGNRVSYEPVLNIPAEKVPEVLAILGTSFEEVVNNAH